MRWLILLALGACSSTSGGIATGGPHRGSNAAPPVTANATRCEDVRPRVETLYRAEAQAKEPTRVDEAVADNTAMVMNDCAKQPAAAVPCLAKAGSVAELELQCLIPLDEEGTEGEELAR
jgi:hypothetical protein